MTNNYEDIEKRLDMLLNEIMQIHKKDYENTKEAFTRYYEISTKYNNALKKYHWPPFSRTYTDDMNAINSIIEENNTYDNKEQKISNYFIAKLNQNNYSYLDYLFNSWSEVKELEKRISILKDIIIAYKSGYYTLSIPVTMIQVEGIIAEYNKHIGNINSEKNIKYFNELFTLNGKIGTDNPANDFVSNILYDHFKWGDGKNHETSRHAIIHGENVSYSTIKNAVKIIYLLDFIIYIAYILEKEI